MLEKLYILITEQQAYISTKFDKYRRGRGCGRVTTVLFR